MHTYMLDIKNENVKLFKEYFPEVFNGIEFNLDILLHLFGFSDSLFIKRKYKLDPANVRTQILVRRFPAMMEGNELNIQQLFVFLGRECTLFDKGNTDNLDNNNVDLIVSWIKNRIKENRNANLIFTGQTGSGKSYSAMKLGEMLDPDFDIDKIVFDVKSFLELINQKPPLPKGSVLIFDDAGVGLSNREWSSLSVKIFGKLTQNFRYRNLITIFTVPAMDFIEKQTRMLIHMYFEMTQLQGVAKPLIPYHPYRGNDMLFFKYPKIWAAGYPVVINILHFALPSKTLVETYEEKKHSYMDRTNHEFLEEIEKIGSGKSNTGKTSNAKEREIKRKAILELRKQGFSTYQIAEKLNMSQSSVQFIIKNFENKQ